MTFSSFLSSALRGVARMVIEDLGTGAVAIDEAIIAVTDAVRAERAFDVTADEIESLVDDVLYEVECAG